MVCKKCYYSNDENAKFCVKCGKYVKNFDKNGCCDIM